MEFLTDDILIKAVKAQKGIFDSHAVIRWLLYKAPLQYAQELSRFTRKATRNPFPGFHGNIAQQIGELGLAEQLGTIWSLNINGVEGPCALWKKIK